VYRCGLLLQTSHVAWSVSVCWAKTTESIELPFGGGGVTTVKGWHPSDGHPDHLREGALLRRYISRARCYLPTHRKCACPLHATHECIRLHDGSRVGDVASCQITLDICFVFVELCRNTGIALTFTRYDLSTDRVQAGRANIQDPSFITPAYLARHIPSRQISVHVVFVPPTRLYSTNLSPELNLLTVLSVVLLLQSGIRLATTLSLALHLLYKSTLKTFLFRQTLGLVGSHDRNPSVSASGL